VSGPEPARLEARIRELERLVVALAQLVFDGMRVPPGADITEASLVLRAARNAAGGGGLATRPSWQPEPPAELRERYGGDHSFG
jgi:hypothetical protein